MAVGNDGRCHKVLLLWLLLFNGCVDEYRGCVEIDIDKWGEKYSEIHRSIYPSTTHPGLVIYHAITFKSLSADTL